MNSIGQKIYINSMILITALTFIGLSYLGLAYYSLPVEQRFFHPLHQTLKPSGLLGHGLGIIGSLCMTIGVFTYMIRKRKKSLARIGKLKNWLEFHIFLCSIGPIMVLFHTAFKFGGIVAISFWSMVAVVVSGIVGRFIYNHIPRSIQGQELTLGEVKAMKNKVNEDLQALGHDTGLSVERLISDSAQMSVKTPAKNLIQTLWQEYRADQAQYQQVLQKVRLMDLSKPDRKNIMRLVKVELRLRRKITHLQSMQSLFRSWHVVHLPFALIMMVIMIVHIMITLAFGYKWIF